MIYRAPKRQWLSEEQLLKEEGRCLWKTTGEARRSGEISLLVTVVSLPVSRVILCFFFFFFFFEEPRLRDQQSSEVVLVASKGEYGKSLSFH